MIYTEYSTLAVRQMVRNFERISQLLREVGQDDRSFEYAGLALEFTKRLSVKSNASDDEIYLTKKDDGKELARIVFINFVLSKSQGCWEKSSANYISEEYPIETIALWGDQNIRKSIAKHMTKHHSKNLVAS